MIVESISLVNAKTQIRLIFSSKADGTAATVVVLKVVYPQSLRDSVDPLTQDLLLFCKILLYPLSLIK